MAGSENAGREATGAGGRMLAGSKASNEAATAAENADARDARENVTNDSENEGQTGAKDNERSRTR